MDEIQKGILFLISTPIGNLKDITLRAIEALFNVDILLCEDTRVTGKLTKRLKNREMEGCKDKKPFSDSQILVTRNPKLISYHDHNEEKLNPKVLNWLKEGKKIGLVSDAGTPLISDPGYKLVRECLRQNIQVESIPGPSSVLTALTLSGFPPDKFLFLGYLPRKSTKRKKLFTSLSTMQFKHLTCISFESPYRLVSSMKDIYEVLGEIEIVVCRELTKMYEEIKRGNVSDVMKYFEGKKVKGEITMLFNLEKNSHIV